MFERFTLDAREAVALAQQEARMLHHRSIGTEHLLIGLAGTGDDPASTALRGAGITPDDLRRRLRDTTGDKLDPAALATLGIDLDQVRRATEDRFGVGALDPAPQGRPAKGHIPLTDSAKKSLELALRVSVALKSGSISSGHLLIGILDEPVGLGARLLPDLGVDVPALRSRTVELLSAEAA